MTATTARKPTKKSEPKLLAELSRVCNETRGIFQLRQLWEYNGKKFIFKYRNENGTAYGFDSNHCIIVFNALTDEWKQLADVMDIRSLSNATFDTTNYHYKGKQTNVFFTQAESFMKACAEYVKLIY